MSIGPEQSVTQKHGLLHIQPASMQVDEFELAEETPVKKSMPSPAAPQPASPEVTDFQLPKVPMSAERRTAEWVTALSPVMESDEGTPGHVGTSSTGTSTAAGASTSSGGLPLLLQCATVFTVTICMVSSPVVNLLDPES